MSLRFLAFAFFLVLLAAAALNYIPGIVGNDGLVFGIFALDIYDDALHLASALWALFAALKSRQAARMFLILFGFLYFSDGVLGYVTGFGFLDLAIFTNASQGLSFTLFRLFANLPHILLGGTALYAGLFSSSR